MGQVYFQGPDPDCEQWCGICSMLFKNAVTQTDEVKAAVKLVESGPDVPDQVIDMGRLAARYRIRKPEKAVTLAPQQMMGGAVMPTCWSHTNGLSMSAVLPATALPPGSVPFIGGGRR